MPLRGGSRLSAQLAAGDSDFLSRLQSATETNRYTIAANLGRQGADIALVDKCTMVGTNSEGLAMRPFELELPVSLVHGGQFGTQGEKRISAVAECCGIGAEEMNYRRQR